MVPCRMHKETVDVWIVFLHDFPLFGVLPLTICVRKQCEDTGWSYSYLFYVRVRVWPCIALYIYYKMCAVLRTVRPVWTPCGEILPTLFWGQIGRFLCLFLKFCYLHTPKFRVKEQFSILFHMVFLREALIRRTFALAIGTQAMLALPDTPLGESVRCGGIQTAQLQ